MITFTELLLRFINYYHATQAKCRRIQGDRAKAHAENYCIRQEGEQVAELSGRTNDGYLFTLAAISGLIYAEFLLMPHRRRRARRQFLAPASAAFGPNARQPCHMPHGYGAAFTAMLFVAMEDDFIMIT